MSAVVSTVGWASRRVAEPVGKQLISMSAAVCKGLDVDGDAHQEAEDAGFEQHLGRFGLLGDVEDDRSGQLVPRVDLLRERVGVVEIAPVSVSHENSCQFLLINVWSSPSKARHRRCGLPATRQLHKLLIAPGTHRGVEPMYSSSRSLAGVVVISASTGPRTCSGGSSAISVVSRGAHDFPVLSARRF